MTVLVQFSIILTIVHVAMAEDTGGISWGTVGVTWALCTVTTIFLVAVMWKLRNVVRRKYKKGHPPRRDHSTRDSKRSAFSSSTRTTAFSHNTARSSSHSDYRQVASKSAHMARSVSEETDRHSRRKTADFTSKWCTERGLNENTAKVLRQNGFMDSITLTSLRVDDVTSLGLTSKAEECVLRKVLLDMEPLDIQDTSIAAEYSRGRVTSHNSRKISSSEHCLAMAGPSQTSSQTGVSTPLLDRAQSYNDMDDSDAIFPDGLHSKSSKSYDVIEEGKSRMFGASSAIKIPEVVDPSPPVKKPTNVQGFNGLLSDKGLYELASELGMEWQQLGALLGIPTPIIQQIKLDHVGNTKQQIFDMLRLWRDTASGSKEQIKGTLEVRLETLGRRDLAEKLLKEQVTGSVEKMSFHSIV